MDDDLKKLLGKTANTIRQLTMEAVQKTGNGHPGMPMGCAELGAYLYGVLLKHNPKNSKWLNRDRVVLSAGHGSMWLYSLLHLSGFKVSLDDIKNLRKLHSKTPGHPEYGHTDGVEATTGPLGQGLANAVGMALGLKLLAQKFNREGFPLFDSKVYCVAGDGCMMEGITSEASSFAGHLGLNNLVIIHDANNISLDGPLSDSMSEDTMARYKAYGFEVHDCDGYDFDAMNTLFMGIRKKQEKPVFINFRTMIGRGAPNKEGTHKVHGSALGADEVAAAKEFLGLPKEEFYIPQAVLSLFGQKLIKDESLEADWNDMFRKWALKFPDLAAEFEKMQSGRVPKELEAELKKIPIKSPMASRSSSAACIQVVARMLPQLYGGSADLSGSDETMMKDFPIVLPHEFAGRNMKYGVREFAMAAMSSGLFLTGMIVPFCGTFLTFSDYMRNAIRLASLSMYHVIYQFTHDSIFVGEDGPTHQPIEHFASLRAMPNFHFIRPGDANEVKMAWIAALEYKGPSAICLSRQPIETLAETDVPYAQGMAKGGYIIKKEKGKADYTLFATGSELPLAMNVATALEKLGKQVRVVSMPCWAIFDKQSAEYKRSVLEGDLGIRVSIEAGAELGWHKYTGRHGIAICMETFGLSASAADVAQEFGFTVDAIVERLINAPSQSA